MIHLSDQELVDLYLNTGDNSYFAEIYKRHYPRVYHRCLHYTESHADAQDFTQDIFIRLVDKLRYYKGEAKLSTWLHSITVNYCIDQLRRTQKVRAYLQAYASEQTLTDDRLFETDEQRMQVAQWVLTQLSTRQRELLLAKYEQGTQFRDIAAQRDLTTSAVKMRIKRARDRARRLYHQVSANENR